MEYRQYSYDHQEVDDHKNIDDIPLNPPSEHKDSDKDNSDEDKDK